MDNFVPISKQDLELLVRKANLHHDTESVTISRDKHHHLLKNDREFTALKKGLLEYGTSAEHISVIIQHHLPSLIPIVSVSDTDLNAVVPFDTLSYDDATVCVVQSSNLGTAHATDGVRSRSWRQTGTLPLTPPSNSLRGCSTENNDEAALGYDEPVQQYFDNREDRSVVLSGLSPNTTLTDIAKTIRGGIVLNMYLRQRERIAHIAFVNPLAAEKFIMHCKRNDLYIKSKRIHVYWDEKQHYMPGYLAKQVHEKGATRNLVITAPKPEITPASVREDLEHIHTLEVVSCEVGNGQIWISLNGIKNAIDARNCMQSRFKYKGTRIQFWQDECDQPLAEVGQKSARKRSTSPKKSRYNTVSHPNRFALLGDEYDEQIDESFSPIPCRSISIGPVWPTDIAPPLC